MMEFPRIELKPIDEIPTIKRVKLDEYVKIKKTNKKCQEYQDTIGHVGRVFNITEFNQIIFYRVRFYNFTNPNTEDGCFIYDKNEVEFASIGDYLGEIPSCLVDKFKNRLGENKNMKLLDIYFERKREALAKEFETKKRKLFNSDPLVKALNKLQQETKIGKQERFQIPYVLNTEEIDKKFDKLDKERNFKSDKLNTLKDEIEAQLEVCETYEQKQAILKAYKVIDESGKLTV